jgi:excisionase family DNA binding protein
VAETPPLLLQVPAALVEAVAARAAELVTEHDRGFLDVDGAAAFLGGCTRKRIYNLVERGELPHYKAGGRLLFDPRQLRNWVRQAA